MRFQKVRTSLSRLAAFVFLLALALPGNLSHAVAKQNQTVFDAVMSMVDDTTCDDGIGRTFTTEALNASVENNGDTRPFLHRHQTCAGISGITAVYGHTPVAITLMAQCSAPVTLTGSTYEWVICNLIFIPEGQLLQPVPITLSEFQLVIPSAVPTNAFQEPDFYLGQETSMAYGVKIYGPATVWGMVAFATTPGEVEPPFLLYWKRTGDYIIADEMEPDVAEIFIQDRRQ